MEIVGFSNATDVLKGGVYILVHRGEVVYVGKAKRMLNRLAAHLSARSAAKREKVPAFIRQMGMYYDEVHIRPEHPDRIDELERTMIELFKPRYNTLLKTPGPTTIPHSLNINGVVVSFNQPMVLAERRI